MLIANYVKQYTSGERFCFRQICQEVVELMAELIRFNRPGIKEEWQDVLHFLQMWLYWRFKVNGEIWNCTMDSVDKFMNRVEVWRKIYEAAGLDPMISNFAGNYKKLPKVIKQLGKFGIGEDKATEAYSKIVQN